MAATTLRLPDELKQAAEDRARQSGVTLTAFINAALRSYVHERCPTCGASRQIPAGRTEQFEQFFQLHARAPVYIVTRADGTTRVWKGRLWRKDDLTVTLAPIAEHSGERDAALLRDHVVYFEEGDTSPDGAEFERRHPDLPRIERWGLTRAGEP